MDLGLCENRSYINGMDRVVCGVVVNDNDRDVYFTLTTSDSRLGKYGEQ